MVILILVLLGLCFGSFVNAFIWRLRRQAELQDQAATAEAQAQQSGKQPSKKQAAKLQAELDRLSISKGRSMCVHCGHELAAKDLVPVLSYITLRGRCRYCHKPIPDTPLSELVTPLLFLVSYIYWPVALTGAGLVTFCLWLVFLVGFVALALYDLRWYELPHKIVLPLIVLALLQAIAVAVLFDAGQGGGWQALWTALYGGLIGGGLFYLLYTFSPKMTLDDGTEISKWIGGGDITLGLLLGLLVGGPANALLMIFVASLLGTIVALPLLLTGRADRTSHLPFGPFLIAAAIIVMLCGTKLVDWYLGYFVG